MYEHFSYSGAAGKPFLALLFNSCTTTWFLASRRVGAGIAVKVIKKSGHSDDSENHPENLTGILITFYIWRSPIILDSLF